MREIRTGRTGRLVSLDALRGFNMFWIIGAAGIANGLSNLKIPGASLIASQLRHAPWNGFRFNDLIYPMFIFVVGISVSLALGRRREKGEIPRKIVGHIFFRTALFFGIGLYMSNSGLNWYGWLHNLRWMGVLQRIALCNSCAALMVLYTGPRRQAGTVAGLLILYWLLLRFVPVPGYGAGIWNPPEANFANYFDSRFLPGRLYYHTWDPEGLLSTMPALATCLLGVLTGHWLRKPDVKPEFKAGALAIAGMILALLGLLWSLDFPLNKKIWTSSYTLLTAGLSAAGMALFYWLIDIRGFQRWAYPFVVIGRNSLFIYVAADFIPFGAAARFLLGIGPDLGNSMVLIRSIATLGLEWLLLWLMYRFRIFVKL